MKRDNSLQVYYNERLVGTLAMTAGRKIAFQYSKSWIEKGFSISPFSLPLKDQVFIPTKDYFQGLFGVFADSLPDGWGRLLLNRLLRSYKQNPDDLTVTSGGARPKIMTSIDGGQWIQEAKKRFICLQLRHFWSWILNSQVWIIMVL